MTASIKIPIGIQLLDPVDVIENKILKAIRDTLNEAFTKALPSIDIAVKNRTRVFFETSREALALVNGPLDKHFGIPSGEALVRVGSIIQTIINNIYVRYIKVSVKGKTLTGGIEVNVLKSDFKDVLNNSEAVITTDNGDKLPWLEWLLLRGDNIIVSDHVIKFGSFTTSRSGGAVMIEKAGGFWRVPPQYSGTIRKNWLTRSIFDVSGAYVDMINDVLKEKIEAVL